MNATEPDASPPFWRLGAGIRIASRAAAFCLVAAAGAGTLDWQENPAGRHANLTVPASGRAGFTLTDVTSTRVAFTNWLAEERHLTNQIFLNGSGVAAGDVDGDGWCDLYFCGLDGPNALFRNLGGWKFEEITAAAGVSCADLDASGAALADLDGDGDLDLVVNSVGGGTRIFLNDGHAHFQVAGPAVNLGRCGTSLALGDIDGDGDLDLYIANYRTVTIRDQPNTRFSLRTIDGQPQVVSIDDRPITSPELVDRFEFRISAASPESRGTFAYEENGEPDLLLRNDGHGRFTPVPFTNGNFLNEAGEPLAKPPLDWGLSVMFRDLNGDGAPDLYVCNDFKSPDRIWINDGRGRFRAIDPLALRQTCLSSMGVDFADVNRDGYDDFFVVDMLSRDHFHRHTQRIDIKPELLPIGAIANRPQASRNMLYLNRGDGTWAECAQFSGLEASEWSWTPIFLDVDLDGYEDLLISNGFERDSMNVDVLRRLEQLKKEKQLSSLELLRLRRMFPRLATANLAFRNLGNLKFEEMGAAWGFNLSGVSQGMCLADLDNDGDLDVIINNLNAAPSLYRNETSAPRLAVKLKGRAGNSRGIGARIKVSGGAVPEQAQEILCGGRYLSSDDAMRVFAAGSTGRPLTIEVSWRSGQRSVVRNAQANRIYEIAEPAGAPSSPQERPGTLTPSNSFFHDVSALLNHVHHEEFYDDFARQPTLPNRLSQLGPGVSWFDVDDDGWDDLILPSGKGGQLAVFRNNAQGGFMLSNSPALAQPVTRDQTTVLGWRKAAGRTVLLAGSANYEDGLTNGSVVREFDLAAQRPSDPFPGQASSTGPLALADVNGDGALDLFVGGRVIPGQYPARASSLLFVQRDGRFQLDPENSKRLAQVGLVSGAAFSDLDGDGDPDLVLACDGGPLRLFRNTGGVLSPWDVPVRSGEGKSSTLSQLVGWWNGVTTADFDGDGRPDLAASNWGQNTRYESFRTRGLRMFHLRSDSASQWVEGYAEPVTGRLLPLQPFHLIGLAIPSVRERVTGHDAYARSTLPEIHGADWQEAVAVPVTRLETMVFLNRGDAFEAVALPLEAQLAPAFAITAADLDGDGHEDLVLSQNFFASQADHSRHDAGRGLWLRGDGRGGFKAVPGQESGLRIYGEQRGAALADYDRDGRVDIVVTQNGAATKLYHNTMAKPGLRVRLAGPPGNLLGIGAALRLVEGETMGPLREVHAGSGYWSQDSAVQVLTGAGARSRLWVRWPGGKTFITEVPAQATEILVGIDGTCKKVR